MLKSNSRCSRDLFFIILFLSFFSSLRFLLSTLDSLNQGRQAFNSLERNKWLNGDMEQILWNCVSRCVLGEGKGGKQGEGDGEKERGMSLHGHLFTVRWMHSAMARGMCSPHYTCRTGEDKICAWRKKGKWTSSCFYGLSGYLLSSNWVQFLPPGRDSEPRRSGGG